MQPDPAVAACKHNRMVPPSADSKAQAAGRIGNTQQQQSLRWQRGVHAIQQRSMRIGLDIMQDIQDDYRIGGAEFGDTDIALNDLGRSAECAPGALHGARHQFDAAYRLSARSRRPGRRPPPVLAAAFRGVQHGGQQA